MKYCGPTNFAQSKLKNGLRVLSAPMEHTAEFACEIRFEAGSAHEPTGEEGIANLTRLCALSSKVDGQFPQLVVEELSGSLASQTAHRDSLIAISVPGDNAEGAFRTLAALAKNSEITRSDFEAVLPLAQQEIARSSSHPLMALDHLMYAALFPDTRASKPLLGFAETLQSMQPQSVNAFRERNWNAGSAVLSLAGSMPANLDQLLEKYFGELSPGNDSDRSNSTFKLQPNSRTARAVSQQFPGEKLAHVRLCYALEIPDFSELQAVAVMHAYLGGGLRSILHNRVCIEDQAAFRVSSGNLSFDKNILNLVQFTTIPERVEPALRSVFKALSAFKDEAINDDLLQACKRTRIAQIALSYEKAPIVVSDLGTMAMNNQINSYEETKTKIESISSAKLKELAASVFKAEQLTFTALSPLPHQELKEIVTRVCG